MSAHFPNNARPPAHSLAQTLGAARVASSAMAWGKPSYGVSVQCPAASQRWKGWERAAACHPWDPTRWRNPTLGPKCTEAVHRRQKNHGSMRKVRIYQGSTVHNMSQYQDLPGLESMLQNCTKWNHHDMICIHIFSYPFKSYPTFICTPIRNQPNMDRMNVPNKYAKNI